LTPILLNENNVFQVLLALRYLGSGCFQREDADLHGLSQPTISRCTHRVLRLIAEYRQQYVKFPVENEFATIVEGFRQKQGFPGVIGAIDGTHVAIINPGGDDSELFR
jgi:nuclease HARBI1